MADSPRSANFGIRLGRARHRHRRDRRDNGQGRHGRAGVARVGDPLRDRIRARAWSVPWRSSHRSSSRCPCKRHTHCSRPEGVVAPVTVIDEPRYRSASSWPKRRRWPQPGSNRERARAAAGVVRHCRSSPSPCSVPILVGGRRARPIGRATRAGVAVNQGQAGRSARRAGVGNRRTAIRLGRARHRHRRNRLDNGQGRRRRAGGDSGCWIVFLVTERSRH